MVSPARRSPVLRLGLAGLLVAVALCIALLTPAAQAAALGLVQKPGTAGCVHNDGRDSCADATAMQYPQDVTVSPDDKSVYVAAESSGAIAIFDRAADGQITQKTGLAGCISETGNLFDGTPCINGMGIAAGFIGPRSVTVSPDGKNLYVTNGSGSAVAIIDRAPDGTLSQRPALLNCVSETGIVVLGGTCIDGKGLSGARAAAVSPDGANVYVASEIDGAVAVFDRAADGQLTQKAGNAGCISNTGAGPCADGTALDGANSVTVSPDGKSVYVTAVGFITAAGQSTAVAVFDRAADGSLTQKPGLAGCLSDTGAGPCVDATALGVPNAVAVSPDGRSAYVADGGPSRAVAVFDRATDGTLTQKAGTAGCISETGAGPCVDGTAVSSAQSVDVSPDGANVFVTSFLNNSVAALDRSADGTLSQKPGTAGCISADGSGPCVDGRGLNGANSVAVSADAKNVYVAGSDGAVAVFDRADVAAPPPPPPSPPAPPSRAQPGCPFAGVQAAGSPGADALTGLARRDVLFGLAGADRLRGLAGRDCLYGGDGNDRLSGGSGADRLFGGAGDDRLDGEDDAGNRRRPEASRVSVGDRLSGGAGADRLVDRRGRATLSGGAGNDRINARDRSASQRRRADTVRCGRGRDLALVDAADRVAADCERVQRRH
jgi:DNA-binding beta-propeller fold protein YncE